MQKITIITACFNSERSIKKCVESVNSQTYENIEHLFIDGASNDRTVTLVKQNSIREFSITSEPDLGIYDAMNKGLSIATGDYILFLNSDDFLISDKVIADLFSDQTPSFDICFAGILYDRNESGIEWVPTQYPTVDNIRKGWHSPHPGFIISKRLASAIGEFNINLSVSADFDFMLRATLYCFEHSKEIFLPKIPITCMDSSGTSSKFLSIIRGNLNVIKSLRSNHIKINGFLFLSYRLFPKIKRKLLLIGQTFLFAGSK